MNSWAANSFRGYRNDSNAVYQYDFSPYANAFLPDGSASLIVQGYFKIASFMPFSNSGVNPVGQFSLMVSLWDYVSQRRLDMLGNMYDNRPLEQAYPVKPNNVANDPYSGAYVSSALNIDNTYTTPDIYSANWTDQIWPGQSYRFYRMTVTPTNIANAARDLNATFGTAYSTNANDYSITLIGVLQETGNCPGYSTALDCGSRISMGTSFHNIGVYQKLF